MGKNLIIYYSRRGENYVGGQIKSIAKGNTHYAAEFIAQAVNGDLFEIETVIPYAEDYKSCIEKAKHEMCNNARPELKRYLTDISQYSTIFVCGPCWWGTYPMAVFSQLERLEWEGKKVVALMTHEGSGIANSERDLKKYCVGATVGKGLAVVGSQVQAHEKDIKEWAKSQV